VLRFDTTEHQRLKDSCQRKMNWRKWGPYLSDRAWGTVREDYSPHGTAWDYFPHDHARSRAYRWNEDGLAGISDEEQTICFALALWNGRDPILKERFFGLSGPEGNHGEDVKEYYFYLDSTPTHSYMKMLYKYPQAAYPYSDLIEETRRRGSFDPEYELLDTGIFEEDRCFDVIVTYAKVAPEDILINLTIHNRGPEEAICHTLPTIWFRNTWSWGYPDGPMDDTPSKPVMRQFDSREGAAVIALEHPASGAYFLYADRDPELLFTENESNMARLFGGVNEGLYVKDAFHRHVIHGEEGVVNPEKEGTKAAAWYTDAIPPGEQISYRMRLSQAPLDQPWAEFDALVEQRWLEADEFYASTQPGGLNDDEQLIWRQAFAGLLWTKQLYYYDVTQWLMGDPAYPPPPAERKNGRNADWTHLNNFDIISMPDKWEYPWFAAWDLAFHTLPLALVDPDFAKQQLILMTREWYMHPNGQLPAYEWAFGDVNPPVHAWAAWRVYQIDTQLKGESDRAFLETLFHKLLLNFTWWVNRKDADDNNIFQGGFLGLDNIGVFDRSGPLPIKGHIDQSDGTAWMGFYCLIMLNISLELARENHVYEDMATKFFEHFLRVAHAMSGQVGSGYGLWDESDGFFYDALHTKDERIIPLKVRSLVGLLPIFAVAIMEFDIEVLMPEFFRRLQWMVNNRPELTGNMASVMLPGEGQRHLLAILTRDRLVRVLGRMLDEREFLSPYGIRSLSKAHEKHPYNLHLHNQDHMVNYEPAESTTGLFGGNSNWRGPIWFPINYLIIESLRTFHRYYGQGLKVECPTGSGNMMTLDEVADELTARLQGIFLLSNEGRRPVYGGQKIFKDNPHWQGLILFYEYFHGDNGAGLGASHQTGWTALIASLLAGTMDAS